MDANILVVDDEPEIADLVEVYLKSEGAPSSNAARAPKRWPAWPASGWIWPFWT